MVEHNVGYWACGGVSVIDPLWETKLEQRIAVGQRTGKTMLSPERRILVLDQLADGVLGALEELCPPDGVPWLFPGRRTTWTFVVVGRSCGAAGAAGVAVGGGLGAVWRVFRLLWLGR